jgi:hypothetical protein
MEDFADIYEFVDVCENFVLLYGESVKTWEMFRTSLNFSPEEMKIYLDSKIRFLHDIKTEKGYKIDEIFKVVETNIVSRYIYFLYNMSSYYHENRDLLHRL